MLNDLIAKIFFNKDQILWGYECRTAEGNALVFRSRECGYVTRSEMMTALAFSIMEIELLWQKTSAKVH